MIKSLLAAAILVLSSAFIDVAEKEVSVFVIVPEKKKLTIPAGNSFRALARDFCKVNGLDDFVFFSNYSTYIVPWKYNCCTGNQI